MKLFCLKIIRSNSIQIIQSHWIIPQGLVGAMCSMIFNIPHIATVHGSDVNMVKDNFLLKKVVSFIIEHSCKITVNSNFTKKALLKIIKEEQHSKIEIIPMGIDINRFFNIENKNLEAQYKNENVLIFVGRLIKWKGVKYLIKSMPQIIKTHPKNKIINNW